jgi:glutathione S-transferase
VGPNGWLVGSTMTLADVAAYVTLSNLISGFFDGESMQLFE